MSKVHVHTKINGEEVEFLCEPRQSLLEVLREELEVQENMIVKSGGMLGLADLATICNEPGPDLKFEPFSPRYPERILEHDGDCFSAIREKDLVIHHPFESFDVVVQFVRQAARIVEYQFGAAGQFLEILDQRLRVEVADRPDPQ